MIVSFGTKAETLLRLSQVLKRFIILPQVCFTVSEWQLDTEECLGRIKNELPDEYPRVIVRSSAYCEDSLTQSFAGHFNTVGNVEKGKDKQLTNAVQSVIDSYGDQSLPENQIFVQPFLVDISVSGVVFTRDLDTLSPYYILNYDDRTTDTASVTSGNSIELKTLIKFKEYLTGDKRFILLFKAIKEVEEVLDNDCLDIEFAIDLHGKIYLLQVRPIVHGFYDLPDPNLLSHYLKKVCSKVNKLKRPHPYLHGKQTILGVMPDWNPAEMIGIKPRPLALSLYKYLITDRVWAYQRDNYGYRNLRSFPLMVSLLGMPYIDVRISFNSFIPKGLSENLSTKLADFYLQSLHNDLSLHDKVEFDIVFSCFSLDIDKQFQRLKDAGFTDTEQGELKKSLLRLTNNIICSANGIFHQDLNKIEQLKDRQQKISCSHLTTIEKIYWLVEDCGRYGTLPFAGLARAGFIAVQFLRSMVSADVITTTEMHRFLASLNTVAKQMPADHSRLSRDEFLKKYGHLRPGTYDILSERYDEAYDLYFRDKPELSLKNDTFQFGHQTLESLTSLLKKKGLQTDAKGLLQFLKLAIEGREYAKFVFTNSVSEILRLIKLLGLKYSLTAEDCSFLSLPTILHLYATLDHRDLAKILKEESNRNRKYYEVTRLIKLPTVITTPEDILEFELEEGSPNFVTLDRYHGEVIQEQDLLNVHLSRKIVLIASADPGYDWIFSKNIGGLITMYGGANSHMAIRAAELKIPAVIGAGEKNFSTWSRASIIEIDCENRKVIVLS